MSSSKMQFIIQLPMMFGPLNTFRKLKCAGVGGLEMLFDCFFPNQWLITREV